MADIQLDFLHDINVSVQLGDLVYFVTTNPVGVPGAQGNWASTTTPHDSAAREDIILMGPVIDFIPWNGNNINQMLADGTNFNTINTSLALPNSGTALAAAAVMLQAVNALSTLGMPGPYENEDPFTSGRWYRFSDQDGVANPIPFVEEVTNTGRIHFPSTIFQGLGMGATGIIQLLTLVPGTVYEVVVDFVSAWGSIEIDFFDGTTSLNTGGMSGGGISGNVNAFQNIHTFTAPVSNLTVIFSTWNNFNQGDIRNISIMEIPQSSIIADYDDAIAEIYGPPLEDDFIMFSKDNKVNLSSLLGYYSKVQFRNNSKDEAELFAVGADFVESSK